MNIHYIVAFYLGDRLTQSCNSLLKKDRYHYVKKHIEKLNSLEVPHVKKATFVISKYDSKIDHGVDEIIKNSKSKVPIEILYRDNWGGSYAAWNQSMKLQVNSGFDYHFLIEDDYVPVSDYFYQPFIDKFKENTAFICQWWNDGHAAVSNGVFSNKVAKKILETHRDIFCVDLTRNDWNGFVQNQINFLSYAKDLGFSFGDCSKECFHPFLERLDYIKFFGNKSGKIVIAPESTVDWKEALEKRKGMWLKSGVNDEEILRLNKIRNAKATSCSKDPRVFNDHEAIAFFEKNPDNLYILYDFDQPEDDTLIGYVRYKFIDNETLQVSPKIKFYYDNRRFYYGNIYECIEILCKKYGGIKKVICEFAESNKIMIDPLKEMYGFTETHRIKNAVNRKGKLEDIIGLTLNTENI